MKSKITILKDILKIVILIFVIFSAVKSCSKAVMTGDMLNEYKSNINTLYDKGVIGENTKNYLISNAGDSTSNTTATGYFFIIGRGNNGNYNSELLSTDNYLYVGICRNVNNVKNSSNNISWTTNGTSGGLKVTRIGLNATTANTSNYGLNNLVDGFWCYTTQNIRTSVLTLDAYNEIGGSYLTANFTFTPIKDEVVTIDNIQGINAKKNIYQFADVTLGKVEEYLEENRYTLMELTLDNNIVAYVKYNNISKQIINSSYMGIEVADNATPSFDLVRVNNWKLYLNQIYTLNIYNGDENVSNDTYSDKQTFNYIFLKNNAVISNGIITNYGSGDGFTNQDSTNAIIDNTNQNNGFWENAYNNLFVISGDYVENKLNEVKVNLGFSGDYEEEKAFINLITEQNGDFIISWSSYTPHFSVRGEQINNVQMISGDSINFSQLERENEALHEVMTWTRTLIGFSLGYLLIHNYWKTLMLTLGVGAQVYGSVEEESKIATQRQEEKARRNEENIRNAYERQRYRQWLFDHRKR